jgi:hypothetical protein
VSTISPVAMRPVVHARLLEARKLDRGNPNPGNLGSDFGRLGVDFWVQVRQSDKRNRQRQDQLQALSAWRNAIAHQDFDPSALEPRPPLTLGTVKRWRSACNALAGQFERAMGRHLTSLVGTRAGDSLMEAMTQKSQTPPLPAVGSKVRMRFGSSDVEATVLEHRGPLGVGGQELLRVRFKYEDANEPIDTEVAVDEVTPIDTAA